MGKRKQHLDETITPNGASTLESDSDGEDFNILNVEFEWFDMDADIDFHGVKTLLLQLFDIDAQLFDISALTNLIISQPYIGSTVKVDGKETDAYAFLSVLNLQQHKDIPVISSLIRYLKARADTQTQLAPLSALLGKPDIPAIGLVLTERLINVPSEVAPPMYGLLVEEIQWALDEKEPYQFTHYLILSKTYTEIASKLDDEEDRPKKKSKAVSGAFDTMYFHPEDEVLHRHALCHGGFDYVSKRDDGHSDSKRAFQEMGIKPQSHAILIPASAFQITVKEVEEYLRPQS